MQQFFGGTIQTIKHNSSLDIDYITSNDCYAYLMDNGISVPKLHSVSTDLSSLFTNILVDNYNKLPVCVSHTAHTFYFNFQCNNKTIILLPLTTRWVLYYLKIFGVKIKVEKAYRSLLDDYDKFIMDLVFTGKSDICIPVFSEYIKQCKKIKFRSSPWQKEEEETETPESKLTDVNARFRGAEWFRAAQNHVALVGAGGLGSNIAVSLCRVLGDKTLRIYDKDIIEQKNLAGQNFGISDIGRIKSAVVSVQCENFNPYIHTKIKENFSPSDSFDDIPIVITGLDNMAARQLVFSKWMQRIDDFKELLASDCNKDWCMSQLKLSLLIDARLSAEKWQILCVDPSNEKAIKEYEDKWLFDDSEAQEDVCSYKQTAFAAQMCAGYVTNLYINFCSNLNKDANDPLRRYVPFLTEYDATQMILRFKDL